MRGSGWFLSPPITTVHAQAATTPSSRRFINILAEPPAEVAAWLVPRIKAATGNGRYIKYLTPRGVVWRLLTAGRRRNRFLDEAEGKQA